MISIADKIMKRIQRRGRGALFTPKDFLDLGSRAAVDKALSRLAFSVKIRRLTRGIYDYPKKHKILGLLWPSLLDVAKIVTRDSNSQLQITGAQAVHSLGLTTQVPAKAVYLTDGPSRTITIANSVLQLKHVSPSIMAGCKHQASIILQAIRYLGQDGLQDDIVKKISPLLNDKDKLVLKQLARFAPHWSQDVIYKLAA